MPKSDRVEAPIEHRLTSKTVATKLAYSSASGGFNIAPKEDVTGIIINIGEVAMSVCTARWTVALLLSFI
jgi:hypothetical protein